MLDLGLAAALEVLHAAIGGEASRVPESDGILNTKLVPQLLMRVTTALPSVRSQETSF